MQSMRAFSTSAIIFLTWNPSTSATPSPAPALTSIFAAMSKGPTDSPAELSNMTIYDDGGVHIINNEASSFEHEVIVVKNSTLFMESGYIRAPTEGKFTDWPALRLSIGSVLNATGGSIVGSYAKQVGAHGGEAVEIYNGQSGPETASIAYFYDGTEVIGGDATIGVGGNALHVHGFGTEVFIYGGSFRGGKGSNGDDGLSVYSLNSGKTHIHLGSFVGSMEVGDSSVIAFYGCFNLNGTKVSGVFADETYIEVDVVKRSSGQVMLIPVAEQECDTAPSVAPTNFPTLSPQPTVPQSKGGRLNDVWNGMCLVRSMAIMMLCHY
ncbi:hypothetical protein ACHAWF_009662 [Thalassiosira exigua]